jgi:hypothetical protein
MTPSGDTALAEATPTTDFVDTEAGSNSWKPLNTAVVNGDVSTKAVGTLPVDLSMQIVNRDTVMKELDDRLNGGSPPAVEYLFVEDAVNTKSVAGCSPFGFGHACVRYTLPSRNGQPARQKLVNIERGVEGSHQPKLIHVFDDPSDYIFGGTGDHAGKGGIFSRNMCGVRVEKLDDDQILAMDYYFKSMNAAHKAGIAKFKLSGGNFLRIFRFFRPMSSKAQLTGNCAVWTSRGLATAGIISRTHTFPKQILIDVLETGMKNERQRKEADAAAGKQTSDDSNLHVVYYEQTERGKRARKSIKFVHSLASPLQCVMSWSYWNVEAFADVTVCCKETANGNLKAELATGAAKRHSWRTSMMKGLSWVLSVAALVGIVWAGGSNWPFSNDGDWSDEIALNNGQQLRVLVAIVMVTVSAACR